MKKKSTSKKTSSAKKTTAKKAVTKKSAARKTTRNKPVSKKIIRSVTSSTLTFLTESLPGFTVGHAKKTRIQAIGGTKPYSFGLSQGSTLPAGLSFNYRGTLWGTAQQSGDTTIFVKVIDFVGAHLTQAFDLQIMDA
jgi:hypothetical protein